MDNSMNLIINNKDIKIPLFIKIILLILFIFIIFLLKYKISLYDIYDAKIIRMGDYYVQVFIPVDKQNFLHDDKIIIDNKEYNYIIKNIEENYVFYNNNTYMIVNLIVNLDNSYNIENNYIKIKQKIDNKTLFKIILNKLKKGINL